MDKLTVDLHLHLILPHVFRKSLDSWCWTLLVSETLISGEVYTSCWIAGKMLRFHWKPDLCRPKACTDIRKTYVCQQTQNGETHSTDISDAKSKTHKHTYKKSNKLDNMQLKNAAIPGHNSNNSTYKTLQTSSTKQKCSRPIEGVNH